MPFRTPEYENTGSSGLTPQEIAFIQNLAAAADYDAGNVLLGPEIPVGTVNGVNDTFTVDNYPKELISDGNTRYPGFGYTVTGTGPYTITMDPVLAPVQYIRTHY